jgi:hypothetical protein
MSRPDRILGGEEKHRSCSQRDHHATHRPFSLVAVPSSLVSAGINRHIYFNLEKAQEVMM